MLDKLMCSSGPCAPPHYNDGRPQTALQRAYRKWHLLAHFYSAADRSSFNVVDSSESHRGNKKCLFTLGKISHLNDALFKCNHI